jgi:radical SAM superfamily enzyme YgiQ (UPF0313 family)
VPGGSVRDRFTVLLAAATPQFSLGAALLRESFLAAVPEGASPVFLVKSYERVFREVDISFVRDVLLYRPRVVAFSCFFWNLDDNLKLASLAKYLDPSIVTVFGGPEVGGLDDAAALAERSPAIDIVVCGEAELRFGALLLELLAGHPPPLLPGTVTRRGDAIERGDSDYEISDLARLPSVYHEDNAYLMAHPPDSLFTLQTLRGCRSRCAYCLYGGRLRTFPLDRIEREVRFLCSHGARHVRIADAHFGGSVGRALEIFELIRHHNVQTRFTFYPDPLHLDRTYLELARQAGCHVVSLGVESLDRAVTGRVSRPCLVDVEDRVRLLVAHDQLAQVDLMLGLPGQTADSLARDTATLRAAGARRFLFSPLMLFPGTSLHASNALETLPSAQHFAFPRDLGPTGYAEALLCAEIEGILTVARRSTEHLGPRKSLPHASTTRIAGIADALRSSARDIRRRLPVLVTALVELFAEMYDSCERPELAERVRFDLMEHAMRRRSAELERTERAAAPVVLFADETVRWRLHPEAWLDYFDLPGDPRHTLFLCTTPRIYELDAAVFSRLQSLGSSRAEDRPPTPPDPFVRDWARRGVLVPANS